MDLAELGAVLRARKNQDVMIGGVTLEDAASTYIDADVTIGADTVIGPGVMLAGLHLDWGALRDSGGIAHLELDDWRRRHDPRPQRCGGLARGCARAHRAVFASPSGLGGCDDAHVGNFVELKKTTLGPKSKANHLAYLGDATIGERVNIGAGTITCNYDGVRQAPDGD